MSIPNLFKSRMRRVAAGFSIAAVTPLIALAPSAYAAEPFPSRPVTIIVPYAAGGVADAIARTVGQGLAEKWLREKNRVARL